MLIGYCIHDRWGKFTLCCPLKDCYRDSLVGKRSFYLRFSVHLDQGTQAVRAAWGCHDHTVESTDIKSIKNVSKKGV